MDRYIDIYCERLEPGLWAEPVNALTNAAFFVAGVFLVLLARKENALEWKSGLLIVLVFAIGTGSTLFHTYATLWAMLSDVLPILMYQVAFIVLYCRTIIKLSWWKIAVLMGLFVAMIQGAMALPREWLNGSLEYGPALIFLIGLGVYHWMHAVRERGVLLLAAAVFILSLTFRSIDMQLCENFPLGTHFAWHVLNGVVLYLTTRGFVLSRKIQN